VFMIVAQMKFRTYEILARMKYIKWVFIWTYEIWYEVHDAIKGEWAPNEWNLIKSSCAMKELALEWNN
jgi:hypothetical protein